jgi:hypothetical protein
MQCCFGVTCWHYNPVRSLQITRDISRPFSAHRMWVIGFICYTVPADHMTAFLLPQDVRDLGAKFGPCWQSCGFILLSVCTFGTGSFAVMPYIDPLVAVSSFSASTWSVLVVEIFSLTISVFLFYHQDVCTLFCLPQNPLLTFLWPYLAQRVCDLVCCGTTCWPLDGLFPPLGSMWSDLFLHKLLLIISRAFSATSWYVTWSIRWKPPSEHLAACSHPQAVGAFICAMKNLLLTIF